ncbi:MAG: TspO/MBR family protein [Pseudomonadota bacterium]
MIPEVDWIVFGICLAACFAAGTTGAAFPPGPWYERLAKPTWTPPNWLFPVAWMLLYVGMSLAAGIVAPLEGSGQAMALWSLQIALNTLWTPIFFGLRRIKGAIPVVVALWAAVAATAAAFLSLDTLAGLLLIPYVVWCTVAAALNIAVWRLNPDVLPFDPAKA